MDSIRTEVLDFYAKLVFLSIYICFWFFVTQIASIHVMQKMNSKLNLLVLTKVPFFIPVLLLYIQS